MRWHQERDYHGSRTYRTEERPVSQLSLTIAWLLAIVRGKLRKRARPGSSAVLIHDGKHTFSLLGANGHPQARAADCPFPTKSESVNHCDWRVLP